MELQIFEAFIHAEVGTSMQFIGSSMISILASTVTFYVGTSCNFCTWRTSEIIKLAFFLSRLFPKGPF